MPADVWDLIADAIRGVAQDGLALERFRVSDDEDLTLVAIDGDDVLSEDDDDVQLSDAFRQLRANGSVRQGAVVQALRHGEGWLLTDAESDAEILPTTGEAGAARSLSAAAAPPRAPAALWSNRGRHEGGQVVVVLPEEHGLGPGQDKIVQVQHAETGTVLGMEQAVVVVRADGTVSVVLPEPVPADTLRILVYGEPGDA